MWGRQKSDSGQDLAEYAIVFPILMLLLLGIIEFGRIIYSYSAISNAAREGARLAILPGSKDALADAVGLGAKNCPYPGNPIIERVCDRALGLSLDAVKVTVSQPDLDANGQADKDIVQVQVEYADPFLTGLIQGFMPSGVLPLRAAAIMRLE